MKYQPKTKVAEYPDVPPLPPNQEEFIVELEEDIAATRGRIMPYLLYYVGVRQAHEDCLSIDILSLPVEERRDHINMIYCGDIMLQRMRIALQKQLKQN